MKLLLVGCGYWGRNWARTLARMHALAGICEPSLTNQDFLKENYPDIPVYTSLDEALTLCDAQAAVIASTASTHVGLALNCLWANFHILVEKPLALSTEDAELILQVARERDRILAVGHLLMYHPGLLKLKALMDAGELGNILSVQCTRTNMGKIRNEENVWWSLAPHDLSILSLLLDEPFHLRSATGISVLGRSCLSDSVAAWYKTDSGRQGSIQVSWLAPEKKHETVVIGARKIAIFDDAKPVGQKLALLDYSLEHQGELVQGLQRGEMEFISYEMSDELMVLEAKAFMNAINKTQCDLLNDGNSGLEVVKHLNAVQAILEQDFPVTTNV